MFSNRFYVPNIRICRTQRIKQVPNIIPRLNSPFVHSIPVVQHVLHNRIPRDEDILYTDLKPFLVSIYQMEVLRLVRWRAVKVTRRPHHSDSAEINFACDVAAQKGFEDRIVFLLRRAVGAGAVGEELRVRGEGVAEDGARPVHIRGASGALDDGWGLVGRSVGI